MARKIVRIGFNQYDLHRIELRVYDFNLGGLVAQRAFDGKDTSGGADSRHSYGYGNLGYELIDMHRCMSVDCVRFPTGVT